MKMKGMGETEETRNFMNELRALRFGTSGLSAVSRYSGNLLLERSTESPGFTDGFKGSSVSVFSVRLVVGEVYFVTRSEHALYWG